MSEPAKRAARSTATGLRQDIAKAIEQNEAAMGKPDKPSINVRALADKAVLGICETLALLLALPLGDDLYHDKPIAAIPGWHWFYLVLGLFFAGVGPMFPWIRTRTWVPERISASLTLAALDVRLWVVIALLLFLYGTGPEIYQRVSNPTVSAPTAAAAPSVTTAPLTASRFYSTAEKEELADRIAAISKTLNKEILEAAVGWSGLSGANLLEKSKQQTQDFLRQVDDLHRSTLDANKKLWIEAINGNTDLAGELRPLIGGDNAPISRLETAIGNFTNGVSLYFQMYDDLKQPITKTQYVQMIRAFTVELLEASIAVQRWVEQSNARIAARRKSL